MSETPETAMDRALAAGALRRAFNGARGDSYAFTDDGFVEWYAAEVAAVRAAERTKVAEEIEAHAKELMGAAVDRVMSDDPGGQTAAMRAAAIKSVARFVRGEQP